MLLYGTEVRAASACMIAMLMNLQEPNVDDPLNKEAAEKLAQDPRGFERIVRTSISRGERINGAYFPPCSA